MRCRLCKVDSPVDRGHFGWAFESCLHISESTSSTAWSLSTVSQQFVLSSSPSIRGQRASVRARKERERERERDDAEVRRL
jgi:hypothetical protein